MSTTWFVRTCALKCLIDMAVTPRGSETSGPPLLWPLHYRGLIYSWWRQLLTRPCRVIQSDLFLNYAFQYNCEKTSLGIGSWLLYPISLNLDRRSLGFKVSRPTKRRYHNIEQLIIQFSPPRLCCQSSSTWKYRFLNYHPREANHKNDVF